MPFDSANYLIIHSHTILLKQSVNTSDGREQITPPVVLLQGPMWYTRDVCAGGSARAGES